MLVKLLEAMNLDKFYNLLEKFSKRKIHLSYFLKILNTYQKDQYGLCLKKKMLLLKKHKSMK